MLPASLRHRRREGHRRRSAESPFNRRILDETDRDNFTFILDTGQCVGSPARNNGVPDPDIDIYHFMEQTAHRASHIRAKFYKMDSGQEESLGAHSGEYMEVWTGDFMVVGRRTGRRLALGDAVSVRLTGVDMGLRRINYEQIGPHRAGASQRRRR